MSDNKLIAIFIIAIFTAITVMEVITQLSYYNKTPREKAFDCIEASEKTDSDICNCLWKYDIKDTTLCNGK